ncbi:MAG: SH3 domain-containing protein [Anaerolineales bacterium]
MKTKLKLILLIILFFNTGCGIKTARDVTPTPTRIFITATFLPTFTPIPSETPVPNLPTPTVVPVQGIASTQLNVRAQPSTTGQVLGILAANATVQIVGKDPGGNWWQILYPASPDGLGWVTAQYVTVTGTPDVPVIGGNGANQNNGNVAIIQQQLNVRSGPGTDFNSLGTLNPQDVVNLIGKNPNGAWLQVEFASGPDGKGWVNAAFTQAEGVENLPIIAESGQVVGTGTPTGIPHTPTATVVPARDDNDSQSSPVVHVKLDVDTKMMIYSGDVSTPEGDKEDWISFTSSASNILVKLECTGSPTIKGDLLESTHSMGILFPCNEPAKPVNIQKDTPYLFHIQMEPSSSGMQYSTYTVTIEVIS